MKFIPQIIANGSFDFWKSKDFQKLVNFDNVSQTEQDRIFNELEVSVLGLFILKYSHLEKQAIDSFLELMKEVGIEKKHLNTWKKLIDRRLKDYMEHYQIALDQTEKFKELNEVETRVIWSRIETITIDCLSHIRRGDPIEGDPLWKLLREWFLMLDLAFEKIMNDSKINIALGKS